MLDNQSRVGDIVKFAEKCGFAEALGLRTICLRDDSGNAHIVPDLHPENLAGLKGEGQDCPAPIRGEKSAVRRASPHS